MPAKTPENPESITVNNRIRGELANAMAHVRLLSQTDVILPEHLPPAVRKAVPKTEAERLTAGPNRPAASKTLEQQEVEAVTAALKETGGNRTHAAQLLGITRRGLI